MVWKPLGLLSLRQDAPFPCMSDPFFSVSSAILYPIFSVFIFPVKFPSTFSMINRDPLNAY